MMDVHRPIAFQRSAGAVEFDQEEKGTGMLSRGVAKKVTIYLNEDTQHHLAPLYESILSFLVKKGVAGATVTRALAGFGAQRVIHTPKIEVLADHLPVRLEFIETAQKVEEILPTLYEMVTDGLIEVQDTTVVKIASKERPETNRPHERKAGQAKLMQIFFGEADRFSDEPLYDAVIKRLRLLEIAGATVYRGILGYGAKGHTHKQNFWHTSRDLPVMIAVVDTEDKLTTAAEAVEEMLQDGLIVISDVDVVRLIEASLDAQLPAS
jgi:PII-like signaling protein